MWLRVMIAVLLIAQFGVIHGADRERELRVQEQITPMILTGTTIQLKAAEQGFLAIHTEADGKEVNGGVILLHGLGGNPDWQDVIFPLRNRLPEHHWETLSIQLPLPAPGASLEEYLQLIPGAFPRIEAAMEFFKARKINHLVLIGHSLGARTALLYLGEKKPLPKEIKAFVALGLAVGKEDAKEIAALKGLELPFLDLYGSSDLDSVLGSRELKRQALQTSKKAQFYQSEVAGADHFFHGMDGILVARIRDWLAKKAPNPKPIRRADIQSVSGQP